MNTETNAGSGRRGIVVAIVIVGIVLALVGLIVGLHLHAASATNHEALASTPRPVSTVKAKSSGYRSSRTYVGTIQPWNAARVGPQFVSAYVGTVLVRPGAIVKRGDVLATLDCRGSSAQSKAVAATARAISDRQVAVEHESARLSELQSGGFASANESEQMRAKSRAEQEELASVKESMKNRALEVDDCILRAPFDGEIAERSIDPGAYVRPGTNVVTVIDRSKVRIVADAPESDYAVVAPGTKVEIAGLSTGAKLTAEVSRRAPSADEQTRTIHFEIDVPNSDRVLPAFTTATLAIDVGTPAPASEIPLRVATVRGDQASVFVVENAIAKRRFFHVIGETGGTLFVDPLLGAGEVVIEGRALLDDGDHVAAKELESQP